MATTCFSVKPGYMIGLSLSSDFKIQLLDAADSIVFAVHDQKTQSAAIATCSSGMDMGRPAEVHGAKHRLRLRSIERFGSESPGTSVEQPGAIATNQKEEKVMEDSNKAEDPAQSNSIDGLTPEQFAEEMATKAHTMWQAGKQHQSGSKNRAPFVIGGSRIKKPYEIVGSNIATVLIRDDERKVRFALNDGDAALVLYDSDISFLTVVRWEGDLPVKKIKEIVNRCFMVIKLSSARFVEQEGSSAKRTPVQVKVIAPDPDGQVPRALGRAVWLAMFGMQEQTVDYTSGAVVGVNSHLTISRLRDVGLGCRNGEFAIEDLSKPQVASSQFERPALKLDPKLAPEISESKGKIDYSDLCDMRPFDSWREDRTKLVLSPGFIYTVDLVTTECFYKNLWAHILLLSFDHTSQQLVVTQLHAEELLKQLRSTELTPAHDQLFAEFSRLRKANYSRPRSVMVVFHEKLPTHQIESRAASQWVEAFDDNFNRFKAAHVEHFVIEGAREFQELSLPKTFEYPSSYGEFIRLSLAANSVKVEFLKSLPTGAMSHESFSSYVEQRVERSLKFGLQPESKPS